MDSLEEEKPNDKPEESLEWMLACIRKAESYWQDWRKEAKEDYDYYAGRQWSEEERQALIDQGRPPIVFNRVVRTVNALVGMEVQNRQEVKYFPRELSDGMVSELLTSAAKWVRDSCDAEDEESEAFQDSVTCGVGWTETRLDYELDEEGQIIIERADPFECGVDPSSKKRNFDDSRYRYRIKKYSKAEFEEKYPDAEIPQTNLTESAEGNTITDGNPADRYASGNEGESDQKHIEVGMFEYYKVEKSYVVQQPDGKMVHVPVKRFPAIKPQLDAAGIPYTRQPKPRRVYYRAFITGAEILDAGESPCQGFTLNAITALRDRNKGEWVGIVRPMRDPQKWANKWMVQIQHILNTQAKSGKLMYEVGAFANPTKAKKEWARPDSVVELSAGGLQKVQQLNPTAYPAGLDRLLQYALEAVNDVPGTNAEMLGLADRQQAGVLEETRKKAGITIVATLFDGLRRYRKEQGRVLAHYIREYIADGRMIRINSEIGEQAIPLLRDQLSTKYDIIVDEAPSSPNMKEKTFAIIREILPTALQAGIPVPPELLEYAPLPSALINKWKETIKGQREDPEQAEMKTIAKEGAKADVENKKADAYKKMADAQKTYSEAQSPAADPMAELALKRELGYAELNMKKELELVKIQADAQIQQQRVLNDRETKLEVAQMASKPSTTVQLGGEDVAQSLAMAFQAIGEQNQKNMAEMMTVMLQSQAQQAENLNQALVTAMGQVAQAMTAPKRIIKDKQGRPVGVEIGE